MTWTPNVVGGVDTVPTMWHGSTGSWRRIKSLGLIPTVPRDALIIPIPGESPVVYLTTSYPYAKLNARGGDVLLVDVTGLDLVDAGFCSFLSLVRIDPSRLSRA